MQSRLALFGFARISCTFTPLSRGTWISFLDTEEAHAVMLAYAADRSGLPWRDDTGI